MIVIVLPQLYGVHGIARYVQSFAQTAPDGYEIAILAGSDRSGTVDLGGAKVYNLPLPKGRLGLAIWSLHARRCLKGLARQGKVDVINLHIPPLIPSLLVPRLAPVVLTAHTTYLGMSGQFYGGRDFDSQWGSLTIAAKKLIEKVLFRRADCIVTLTEQGRKEIERYGYRGQIEVIPNGVHAEKFEPDRRAEKDIDVLFVGRIEKRKGSRAIVPVCRELVERAPQARICIVGYGDDEDFIRAGLADCAANVTFAGRQPFDEVLKYYRRSKVYASTSYYEGLPGTCLEAMSAELVPVVWDYLFYRDVVVDGVNGRLIAPNAHGAFVDALLDVLADEAGQARMSKAARLTVLDNFRWNDIARRLVDLNRGIAKTRGARWDT